MLTSMNGTTLSHYLQKLKGSDMLIERDLPVRVSLGPRWQLMFVDSHIEMLSGTQYQHLVSPIIDNVHTIAMQITDVVDNPTVPVPSCHTIVLLPGLSCPRNRACDRPITPMPPCLCRRACAEDIEPEPSCPCHCARAISPVPEPLC